MRVLYLGVEPFNGEGGLSKYNRAMMLALCTYQGCRSVTYMPLAAVRAANSRSGMPRKVQQVGSTSTVDYGRALRHRLRVLREARRVPQGFDVIVCGHVDLTPLAHLVAKTGADTKVVQVIYGREAWKAPASSRSKRWIQGLHHVISASELTAQRFCQWAQPSLRTLQVVPHGIDLYRYTPGPKDPVLMARYGLRGKRVLMSLGGMNGDAAAKGFDKILEVMPRLLRHDPNLMYLCSGAGDDRARLMSKAESLGIAQYVVFSGRVSEIEKIQHFRLADCFAMPGWGAGCGVTCLEAMACGVPVVGSAVDGSHEVLFGGQLGKVVNPFNLDHVEAGVMETLCAPILPDRALLASFSTQRFVENVHGLMHEIMGTSHEGADSASRGVALS